jgi:SAM-dependent methyltransferase
MSGSLSEETYGAKRFSPALLGPETSAVRPCPVCGATKVWKLHTQKFLLPEGHPLHSGYEVVGCTTCGMVYADTAASQRNYDEFYARLSKYEEGTTATGSGDEIWDAERLQATAACLSTMWPNRKARLLDVGCANGGLLQALRDLDYQNLSGIDPSPVCAANVARLGFDQRIGTLTNLPDDMHPKFDGVILSHVLEHVLDVRIAIQRQCELLTEEGELYIEVPDATRYEEFYVSPFHFFDTEHINHFSLPTLMNLLQQLDFSIVASGRKEMPIAKDVFYPAIWVLGRRKNPVSTRTSSRDDILVDDDLIKAVRGYIDRSRAEFDPSILERLADEQRPLIVWGVGSSTLRLLAGSALGRANIVAFTDNNPKSWQTLLQGKPVLPPAELSARQEAILITSKMYGSQIESQIRDELGLSNPIVRTFRQ